MIITLTGNLLAERTFEFSSWEPGKTQRAQRESFQVGGKGVNVSRMLARLGAPTLALCFTGGPSGDECLRWIRRHGIEHHAFQSSTPTRTGLVVVGGAGAGSLECGGRVAGTTATPLSNEEIFRELSKAVSPVAATPFATALQSGRDMPLVSQGRAETTFLGPDVAPDEASLAACAAWLDAAPVAHALAFCGSFPGWNTPAATPLRDAIGRRIARGGKVFVDTYGAPLAWFVEKPVALVKINRAEFDQLARETNTFAPAPASSPPLALALAPENPMPARLAAACRRWPAVRSWVVTDGPRPIWHITAAHIIATPDTSAPSATAALSALQPFSPSAFSLQPPVIHEVSPTGAGDVLFAGILHGLLNRNFTLADAIAEAMPLATAKAAESRPPGRPGAD